MKVGHPEPQTLFQADADQNGKEKMPDAPGLPPDEPGTLEAMSAEGDSNGEPQVEAPPVPRGRRRGRRQVMKKTTVKDDEGYLGIYPLRFGIMKANNSSFVLFIWQSPAKNVFGNRFQKMSRNHPNE